MGMENRAELAPRRWEAYRVILSALAGGTMLGASLLPWLVDPLNGRQSAWALPIDLGWQVRSSLFNYGLLCLLCAAGFFFLTWKSWSAWRTKNEDEHVRLLRRSDYSKAALLCLVPMALLLLQYLYIDMAGIATLARGQMQAQLAGSHFGYNSAMQFMLIRPLTINPLSFTDRLALILDNLGPGFFAPLVSILLLLVARAMLPRREQGQRTRRQNVWRAVLALGGALVVTFVLGRGPAGLAANYEAEHLLQVGEYSGALKWLGTASTLNPSLNELSAFHIERGQALYYLNSQDPNAERLAYVASAYSMQKDFLASYQELINVWQQNRQSWVRDQLNTTLTQLAEANKPLFGSGVQRLNNDSPALPWLQDMETIDPGNVYAHYMMGRIFYDMHNYEGAAIQMTAILNTAQDTNMRSAAFTYMGLSSEGEGHLSLAREYLFQAVALDSEYRNNTAREELSGMR